MPPPGRSTATNRESREAHPPTIEDGSNPRVHDILNSTFYDIAPARELPPFDPSFTIKQLVIPKRWIPRFNQFCRRHAMAIELAYVAGLMCRALSVAIPVRFAQWTALATLPLQIFAVLNVFFQFRLTFFKHLVGTYDFWYFLVMNSVWAGCLARYLSDWRIAIVPFMWIDVQNATLLDAFLQDFRAVVSVTWAWCLFLICVISAISFDFVKGVHESEAVLVTTRRTITVKEMLLNAIATVLVLIGRIVYRKRAALKSQKTKISMTPTVQSITLTWPLKLHKRSISGIHPSPPPARQVHHTTKLQLHLTLQCEPLQASDILLPSALARLQRPGVMRFITRLIGIVGLVSTPSVFCIHQSSELRRPLAILSAMCTATYAGVVMCFYQRRLFGLLVMSFDFAFVSLQLTTVHLCVADAFQWQLTSTLCVLSSWLWLHLVLTIDALTPAMRRALSFCSWFQVPVLVLMQAVVVLLWLELSYWDSQGLHNRSFARIRIGERVLQLHVVPCLLSRLPTVTLWALRILYRIATQQSGHELLTIRSHIEFDALAQQRQRGRFRVSPSPPPAAMKPRSWR